MRHYVALIVMAVAMVGCGSSGQNSVAMTPTPSNDSPPPTYSTISRDDFCQNTGVALCERADSCGFTTADYPVSQCLEDYRLGCCVENGLDHCSAGAIISITSAEMDSCSDSLTDLSCDQLDSLLADPSAENVPSQCKMQ